MTVEKRLDNVESLLNNLNESITEIKAVIMEKKEVKQEEEVDEKTIAMQKTMEKLAVITNTAVNKFKK